MTVRRPIVSVGGRRKQLPSGDTLPSDTFPANLNALAGLTGAANKGVYFTAAGAMAVYDLTVFGRSWGALADVGQAKAALGLGTAAYEAVGAFEPAVTAGTTAQYWKGNKTWADFYTDVRAATLTGLSLATGTAISASDTVLSSLGKLQKQISDAATSLATNVRATVLTGYVVGTDVDVAATDSLLVAIQKLQGQMNARAPLASPALTGVPTAPTAALGTNTTQVATMAAIKAAIDALVNGAPGALDALNELAAALGNDPNFATTVTNSLALKAPLASPALSGTPTAPTAATATNTTQIATTAFVQANCALQLSLTGGDVAGATGMYQGINGGYGTGNSSGADWGACIWGIGPAFDGVGVNTSFAPTGLYGLAWIRGGHSSYDAQIGEGLYVYQNGSLRGGIGAAGIKTAGVFYGNGSGLTALDASSIAAGTLNSDRLADSGVLTPTLVNSFTPGGSPLRYRKTGNTVSLSGQVNRATGPGVGTTLTTLPVGYRPGAAAYVLGELFTAGGGIGVVTIDISTAGVVRIIWIISTNGGTFSGTHSYSFTLTFIAA